MEKWNSGLLVGGIITAIVLGVIAIYRAKPQKDIDVVSKSKIEGEVKRLQSEHDRRRTIRLLRLEEYLLGDVQYHTQSSIYQMKLVERQVKLEKILERCIANGLLPDGEHLESVEQLGPPPIPPVLPEMPDEAE